MMPLSRILGRVAMAGTAAATTLGLACGGDAGSSHVAGPPSTPAVWSLDKAVPGDDLQTDTVLAALAPLRVVVRTDGAPKAGVAVTWSVNGASGATNSSTTGGDGVATLNFAYGSKVGSYVVQAAVPQRPELAPISFSGKAVAGRAAMIRVVSGSGQSDTATARLHDDFVVQASDGQGNSTPGAAVDWVVSAGGGSLAQLQTTADSAGTSASRYTLGHAAGANTVTATLHGLDAKATFQVTASPANPAKLTVVSGNNQTGEAGHTLAADYVVKVADSYDNSVAGVAIDWAITSGGGKLSPSQVASGADGLGAARLTLGSMVAVQSVNASLAAWPNVPAVVFSSTATPPPPAPTLVLVNGNGQSAVISTPLPAPIVFRALDAAGLPLVSKTITLTAPGTLLPATAITDAQGFAQTIWILGPSAGLQTLIATSPFTTVVASANAIATLPPLMIMRDPLDGGGGLNPFVGLGQFLEAAVGPASLGPVATATTVTLTHGPHTSVPSSLTIPAGATNVRFKVTAASTGTDTITASAPGFATATVIVTVGPGIFQFFPIGSFSVGAMTQVNICEAAPGGGQAFMTDTTTFSFVTSPNISVSFGIPPFTPITSITIPAGGECWGLWVKGVAAGAATITVTSPGYIPLTASIVVSP